MSKELDEGLDEETAALALAEAEAKSEAERLGVEAAGESLRKQERAFAKRPEGKKRRSSNYALEQLIVKEGAGRDPMWATVKDGFVSEEQAIEHMRKSKLQGVFRAIRIATDTYEVRLVTPEPVIVVTKVKKQGRES
jgi:hypothetical protein